MKKNVYEFQLQSMLGKMMDTQIRIGYWNIWNRSFEKDSKIYIGSSHEFQYGKENKSFYEEIARKRICWISVEDNTLVIGIDPKDFN